jgi:hypothetical protein
VYVSLRTLSYTPYRAHKDEPNPPLTPRSTSLAACYSSQIVLVIFNLQSPDDDDDASAVGGQMRLDFSVRTGGLQAPMGYDKWSYGIRDIGGSILLKLQ